MGSPSPSHAKPPRTPARGAAARDWAASHGSGDRAGAWGLSGSLGQLVSTAGTLFIIGITPAFAVLMCGAKTSSEIVLSLSQSTDGYKC